LSNIKTINTSFISGTGEGTILNLRDSNDDVENVNITRLTQDASASITEMGPSATNLSVSNSTNGGDIVFNHQEETLTGSETVNLALTSVRTNTLTMDEDGDGDADTGYYFEEVNITTSGRNDLDALTIGANAEEDASTADLDQDINITANGAATQLGLEVNALTANGAETITIVANSRVEIAADNRAAALAAGNDGITTEELNTLTISGGANVMIDGLDGADAMITVAAGEMTGNLTLGIAEASDATTSGTYASGTDEDLSVTSGSGDDTIETYEALAGDITTNAGDDSVTVGGNMEGVSAISTGDGDDSVTVEDMEATASDDNETGNENYTVQGAHVSTGAGDDTISADALLSEADWNNNGTVDADNNDTQVIRGAMIDAGEGDDTITFETVAEGASVDAGAGDDTITVGLTASETILAGDTDDNQETVVDDDNADAVDGHTDEVNDAGAADMLGAIVDAGDDADVISFTETNVVVDAAGAAADEDGTLDAYTIIGVDAEVRGAETMNVSALDAVTVATQTTMADQDDVTTGVQNDVNANVIGTVTLNLTNLNQIEDDNAGDDLVLHTGVADLAANDDEANNVAITADIMRFDSSLTTINLASQERWLQTGPATEIYEAGTSTTFTLQNLRDQAITLSAFEATGVNAGALEDDTLLTISDTTGVLVNDNTTTDVFLVLDWESARGLTDAKALTIDAAEAFDLNISLGATTTDLAATNAAGNNGGAASTTDDDDMQIEQFTLTFSDALSHSVDLNGFGDDGRTELDAAWLAADGNNSLDTVLTVNAAAAAGESIDVFDVTANTIAFGNAAGDGEIAADVTLNVTADNVYNITTGTGDDVIDMRADNVRADDNVDTNGDYDRADYVNASSGRDTLIVSGSDNLGESDDIAVGAASASVDDDVFETISGVEKILVEAGGSLDVVLDEAAQVTGIDTVNIVDNGADGNQTMNLLIGNNFNVSTTADNLNGQTTSAANALVVDATLNTGLTNLNVESKDDDSDIDNVNLDIRVTSEGGANVVLADTGTIDAAVQLTIVAQEEVATGIDSNEAGNADGSVDVTITADASNAIDKVIILDSAVATAAADDDAEAGLTVVIENDWTSTAFELDASALVDTDSGGASTATGGLTLTVESGDTADLTIRGTQNDDTITTIGGADTIFGNGGDDTITSDSITNVNDILTIDDITFRAGDEFVVAITEGAATYTITAAVDAGTVNITDGGAYDEDVAIAGNVGTSNTDILSAIQTAILKAVADEELAISTEVNESAGTLTVVQTVAEQDASNQDIDSSTFTAAAATQQVTTILFTDIADDAGATGLGVTLNNSGGTTQTFNVAGEDTLDDAGAALAGVIGANANFAAAYDAATDTITITGAHSETFTVSNVTTETDAAFSTTVTTTQAFAAATEHDDNTDQNDVEVIEGDVDTIDGGAGNDTIEGMVGADVIDGGTGTDTASYASSNAAVSVNLATGVNTGGHAAGDSLTSIENVTGSAFADTLVGSSSANTLNGGAGNDTLTGNGGADAFVVATGGGSDTVTDFTTGVDTMNFEALTALIDAVADNDAKEYEEIADDGADIENDANVIVIGGVTTIGAAAAAIAADAQVTGTDGLIVFSDGDDTFVYHTDDLDGDGTETLVLTLTGVSDATSLVTGDFDLG